MSFKLLVQNIPQNFSHESFKHLFIDFKGHKDTRILGFDDRQQ